MTNFSDFFLVVTIAAAVLVLLAGSIAGLTILYLMKDTTWDNDQ